MLLALTPAGASIVLLDHQQQESVSRRIAGRCRSRLEITDAATTGSAGTRELGSVTIEELTAAAEIAATTEEALSFTAWRALPDALITWSSGSTGDRRAQGHSEVRRGHAAQPGPFHRADGTPSRGRAAPASALPLFGDIGPEAGPAFAEIEKTMRDVTGEIFDKVRSTGVTPRVAGTEISQQKLALALSHQEESPAPTPR
ncbi:hypothetical protein [Streptomyces sp. NPDC026589]|uniref:hypothetical protein n=1 Tax=Streptomyces sp. NPDC026589 TaxID=3155609 RepID=UPI0034021E77